MTIIHLTSVAQLNGILKKDKLTVIDFHASWCGPCHLIAPVFESLSKRYKNVNFLKCDVEEAREVASLYSVSAMPTFIFLKGTQQVDQVRGANRKGLEDALQRHSSSSSSFAGKGQRLGDGSSSFSPKQSVNHALTVISNMDPQLKVLLGLFGAYFVFWYLSG